MTIQLDTWRTRVGASERADGGAQIVFVVAADHNASQRIEMSAAQARQLSRRLKRWADALDPPKPRKR